MSRQMRAMKIGFVGSKTAVNRKMKTKTKKKSEKKPFEKKKTTQKKWTAVANRADRASGTHHPK